MGRSRVQQTFAHGHVHHGRPLDLVASVQALVVPEQDDTDLFFIEIECNAKQTLGTSQSLVTNAGKTENVAIPVETL